MRKTIIILFIIQWEINIHAQFNQFNCYLKDQEKSAREHLVNFQHLELHLKFDTLNSKVFGEVTHTFKVTRSSIDSIELDAVNIKVNKIVFQNQEISSFKQKNNLLTIYFPKKLFKDNIEKMSISYECTPKRGLYFIGWTDSLRYSQRQIWTQGQGIDNRHWIPMFDDMSDKITTDIFIEFNKKYPVISNGVLIDQKELKDNIKVWHYRMNKPHAPYLIMLAIGNYKFKKFKSKSGVEITAYYYPEKEYCVDTTFRFSAQMMDFLENETGFKYPWERYSVIPVQEYMFGAMENTTATIFGDFFLIDEYSINDRDFLPVAAHELAHQWFGDYVTAYSPAHVWLQESFATHYNWLVEEAYFGKDHYDWLRKSATEGIIKESEKNLYPIAHSLAGTTRIYPKGAYVLHMMKYVIGKDLFNASIKRYLQEHPYQNVESNDLMMAIYKETGINLDWFFDEWLYRGGEPSYDVKFERMEKDNQSIGVFYVKQVQAFQDNVYLFKMPIEFEIHFTDGTFINKRMIIQNKDEIVQIPFDKNKTISYVLFDPNSNILKKVNFPKDFEMLKNQAAQAQNMLDRYDAFVAMRDMPIDKKRELLQKSYYKENFHAILSEIVKQLATDTAHPTSLQILKHALLQAHPLVTRTLIDNTPKIPSLLKNDFFSAIQSTKSYINIEKLMWLLYSNYPNEYQQIISNTNKFKPNDRNIEITALAIEYLQTKDKKLADKIVFYASPSFEFRTRINAFNTLIKINYFNNKVKQYLQQASQSANHRLAAAAKETLNYFEKQKH
ncbi:MAG: M1 family metallopeptidase [Bacteroidia bacterium]|nr:M1 family metallopeptidase [Bacteroidia bacterium]